MNQIKLINNLVGIKYHNNYNNVITCCRFCNYGKREKSLDDFFKWIDRIKINYFNIERVNAIK